VSKKSVIENLETYKEVELSYRCLPAAEMMLLACTKYESGILFSKDYKLIRAAQELNVNACYCDEREVLFGKHRIIDYSSNPASLRLKSRMRGKKRAVSFANQTRGNWNGLDP
jgi:hypothetical protein